MVLIVPGLSVGTTYDHMAHAIKREEVMAVHMSGEAVSGRARLHFGCSNGSVATGGRVK